MPSAPEYPQPRSMLQGKTAVITAAAGTGIGFSLAKRCVEEGATVVISDLHERRLNEAADALAQISGSRFSGIDASNHNLPSLVSSRTVTFPTVGLCARLTNSEKRQTLPSATSCRIRPTRPLSR